MDRDNGPHGAEEDMDVPAQGDDELSGNKVSNARLSRRRTKTGCLTCRRRRIKCGEERPRCGNCIKSKRQCEGYNQRVIFKEPNSFRYPTSAAPLNRIPRNEPSTALPATSRFQFQPPPPLPGTSQPRSLPRQSDSSTQITGKSYGAAFVGRLDGNSEQFSSLPLEPTDQMSGGLTHFHNVDRRWPPDTATVQSKPSPQVMEVHHEPSVRNEPSSVEQNQSRYAEDWRNDTKTTFESTGKEKIYTSDFHGIDSFYPAPTHEEDVNRSLFTTQETQFHTGKPSDPSIQGVDISTSPSRWLPDAEEVAVSDEARRRQIHEITFRDEGTSNNKWPEQHPEHTITSQERGLMVEEGRADHVEESSLYWSNASDDEDPYDVTDDEMQEPGERETQYDHLRNNDLGIVVALQAAQDRQDQSLRTYHSFIDGYGPDVLATYRPSSRSSPLNDSITARIFCHFINVTAPCISMFERHPANPSLIFQGRPVPKSQQHIWTYTMPTIALGNSALLQAILALGSLHMAKLQDGPITAPLKHYHLAIRRIGKAVSLPTRRNQLATLAATMLLGWFEGMSSDHSKWTGHLLGARLLIQSIEFSEITKFLKIKKLQLRQARYSGHSHQDPGLTGLDEFYHDGAESSHYLPHGDDVDESLVSIIMGKKLQYDQYGQVLEDLNAPSAGEKAYTQQDIETYETQRDLFWWFCKQDATQSILGGTKLLLPFELWSHCPPRAAVGRRDAIYGTWDHLLLLLGRLADFSAKDLKRKRLAMKLAGPGKGPPGMRPPPPGMGPPDAPRMGPPGGSSGEQPGGGWAPGEGSRGRPPPMGMPQMPLFAGMLPNRGDKVPLPRGFSPPRNQSPDDGPDERPIEDQTLEALEEWQDIHSAFHTLRDNFGPDYQALGPEYSQPIQTPFGPALQYRTFGIAGIWLSYYLGLIVLHRAHPSMPPAAMIAVGAAARQTGQFANEIGRIAAAIAPNASEIQQVNTGIGAALIESSLALFVAGVQFQDPAQRTWTIQRLFDMRRLTGWQTAHSIAVGCETSWKKAAEFGKGPQYTRGPEWQTPSTALELPSRRAQIISRANTAPTEGFTDNTKNRVHYALGLLAMEDDLGNLRIRERDAT